MAEITQTLGFDASAAIETLNKLDQSLQTMEQRLQSAATALQNFNSSARPTIDAWKGIKRLAGSATAAVIEYTSAAKKASIAAAPQAPINMAAMMQTLTSLQGALVGLRATIGNTTAALSQFGETAASNLAKAEKQSSRLSVTFGTLVRVVTTQLIVRAMSMLRNALEESLTAAINFETKLAQIQTIGGPAAGSLQMLAVQVRGLSEEFAKPIEDVAQGYYDILSNQVGNAADAFLVARESARLSTVAVSSFADAANALSSIINSYNMNASDAADISGKLFAAVDVGRFVLSDVANTIGRVTTLGHELGVSLDEVLASLSTLTISGVKPDEAMTLLSNAMRGLIKPTKDMRAAYKELGVANAEVGVATYGFQGFLEKLRGTTNGTASEIAELTENIRVGRGVFGLTGKAAEQYAKNLEAIRGAGAETAGRGAELIIKTNAQQVQLELTRLRNFFINDFGLEALKIIKSVVDSFGGLVNIVKSMRDAMIGVGATLVVFKTALVVVHALNTTVGTLPGVFAAAGVAARGFAAAMLTIPGVIVIMGITAAVLALWRAMDKGKESAAEASRYLDEHFNAIRERENQNAAVATAAAKKIQAERTKTVEEAFRQQQKLVADLQLLYDEDKDAAIAAQEDILDRLKDQLKERVSLISKIISELERKQQESTRIIEKNRDESADLKLKDEERYLDRQISRLGDQAKAVKQLQRARELEGRATKLTQTSDFKGAEDLLKTADQRAQAALDVGEAQLKEAKTVEEQQTALQAISQAESEVNSILQQRLTLREQENQAALAQAEAAQREIAARREQLKDAKRLVEQIGKYEVISKDEKKNTPEAREAARNTALTLTQELEDVLNRGDVNLEQFLGIQDFTSKIRAKFESAIDDRPVGLTFAYKEGIDAILAPLEKRKVELKAIITEVEAASGATFNIIEGFKDIALGLVRKQEELIKALNQQSSLPQEQANLRINQADIIKQGVQLGDLPNVTKEYKQLLNQMPAALGQAMAGQSENLMLLQQRFNSAADQFATQAIAATQAEAKKSLAETSRQFATLSATIAALLEGQAKVAAIMASTPKVETAIQKNTQAGTSAELWRPIAEYEGWIKTATAEEKKLADGVTAMQPAAQASIPPVVQQINAVAASAKTANTELSGMAWWLDKINPLSTTNAVRSTVSTLTGGDYGGKAIGGLMHKMKFFESGGAARGTDTIPSMLSEGEFVVAAKNARRFLPELQAINAGMEPTFESSGGATYNTNVGDIIINESKGPRQTGREVMRLIRREQRRGSGRL